MRLIAFILFAFSATAQFPETLLMNLTTNALAVNPPATWSPTNITTLLSWWIGDNAQTNTSGGITNLPDSWTNGWNLTNYATGTLPVISNNWLNGHSIVYFDGADDYLRNMVFTNCPPGATITNQLERWLVFNHLQSEAYAYVADGVSTSFRPYMYWDTDKLTTVNSTPPSTIVLNKWFVFSHYFDRLASKGESFTNNVTFSPRATDGTTSASGVTFGARYGLSDYSRTAIAEILAFSVTNTLLDRSNIFWYLTNKYGTM